MKKNLSLPPINVNLNNSVSIASTHKNNSHARDNLLENIE